MEICILYIHEFIEFNLYYLYILIYFIYFFHITYIFIYVYIYIYICSGDYKAVQIYQDERLLQKSGKPQMQK